jgi:hypothetical protein
MARTIGFGYLLFAGVVGTVIGVTVYAPQTPRGWFGSPAKPTEEGAEPVLPGVMQASLEAKDHEAALTTTVKLVAPTTPVAAAPISAPVVVSAPAAAMVDGKVTPLLAEAEKAYHIYKFDLAISNARRAQDFTGTPTQMQRARDIVTIAPLMQQLFAKLGDRDELARGYDTHPSLVVLSGGREPTYAVPITGNDKDSPTVDKDPLGYIAAQRKIGKVNFLIKGNKGYIATELSDQNLGEVKLVDQVANRKSKAQQLEAFRKTLVGEEARDPMAWYDLGRFAFQHRLDTQVVDALHQALLLDAKLATTVREDRAGALYASLISHLKSGNKMQAASYMSIIERRYKDTEQGRQARLYYDGKTEELLAAAKETQRKAAEEEARRLAEIKARATTVGAPVVTDEPAIEDPATVATITGKPDEAKALALYEQGAKFCSDAIDKGNSLERDRLYGEALKVLAQAVPLLSKLAEAEKDPAKRQSLEAKVVEANQMKFGATKMRRLH